MINKKTYWLLISLLLLTACGVVQSQVDTRLPTESFTAIVPTDFSELTPGYSFNDPLLKILIHGGLCQYGECWRAYLFYQDGRYQITDGGGEVWEGNIEEKDLAIFRQEVETANYATIRSQPFTEVCPTAYDGSERIYSFYTSHGEEVISSCEYVVDDNLTLFSILLDLLNTILY